MALTFNRFSGFSALLLSVVCLSAFTAVEARAAYIVTATQVGGDVVFDGTGSLNIDAWTFDQAVGWVSAVDPSAGFIYVGLGNTALLSPADRYVNPVGLSGPASFGSGSAVVTTDRSGDTAGLNILAQMLFVPAGYVSNNALASTSIFAGESFASLGLGAGEYTWTWGAGSTADSFTLNVVPEPSTAFLMGLGMRRLSSCV